MRYLRRYALRAFLVAAVLATATGCTVSDKQLLVVLVEEWARSKNMNPTNEDGSLNPIGAGNALLSGAKNALGWSSGDDEIDAVLNAKRVLDNLAKADKLVNEGRKEGDASKIDEAIKLRPDDWSYRSARVALALQAGDLATAKRQLAVVKGIPKGTKREQLLYADTVIDDLKSSIAPIVKGDQCRETYNELANQYEARAALTGSERDKIQANTYRTQAGMCQ